MLKQNSIALVRERFCRSQLGGRLGRHSPAAQKLAFALLGNPYWNRSGSYRLSLDAMATQMEIPVSEIPALLNLLQDCGFCTYEPRSARVTVSVLEALYRRLLPQKSRLSLGESAPVSGSDCEEKA